MPWAKSFGRQASKPSIGKSEAETSTKPSLTLAPIDVPVTHMQIPEVNPDFEIRDEDLGLPEDRDSWSMAHANDITPAPQHLDIQEQSIPDCSHRSTLDRDQRAEVVETEFATNETNNIANPVMLENSVVPTDYNPRRPFQITIATLLLSASAYGGFLWWELQPRGTQPVAVISRAGVAANTTASHNSPATQANNGPDSGLTPTSYTATNEPKGSSNTSLVSKNTRRDAKPDQIDLQNQFLLEGDANISAVDHNPAHSAGNQAPRLTATSPSSNTEQNTNTFTQSTAAIQLQKSYAAAEVDPGLARAFSAYQSGQLGLARQEYEAVLQKDGRNRDALLALAVLDARRGELDLAELRYQKILELDPRDMHANAALLTIRGRHSPLIESRIKYLLSLQPESAPLNFALGNLLASGKRWPEAQAAYFRAHSADPDNADYAFNLAVSLEHLRQTRSAISYYQKALELSRNSANDSHASFNHKSLLARIQALQRH